MKKVRVTKLSQDNNRYIHNTEYIAPLGKPHPTEQLIRNHNSSLYYILIKSLSLGNEGSQSNKTQSG